MTKAASILVTGFRPFLGESVNPSSLLLDWIAESYFSKVDTLLLPVSFEKAPRELMSLLESKSYDSILLLGQAGGRSRVSLERVALNWVETEHPDEEALLPAMGAIDDSGPSALFSTLPLAEWKTHLTKKNLPVEISLSAGGYVCNYLYYQTLRWLAQKGKKSGVCFIHVPYTPEQVLSKPGVPSMDISVMKQVLSEILDWKKDDK